MTGRPTNKSDDLRRTFDAAAGLYDAARPDYPTELFDELVQLTGIERGDLLLEVGCGTGKATIPLAERGFRIVAIEPGNALANRARQNLAGFGGVEVINTTFESWQPPSGAEFALVYAATAWHWVDPDVRYSKAWGLLRPGGHLALWGAGHVFPDGADPFFHELQPVYEEIGEGLAPDAPWPRPGEQVGHRAEIAASGLFAPVGVRHFDWEVKYNAESYINLLSTFSNHIAMQEWQRDRLYGEIRCRLGQRPDGLVRRHWGAALEVAVRIAAPGR